VSTQTLQVEVDEVLVGNAGFAGQGLEVVDDFGLKPKGHRLLQALCVRIAAGLAEVVGFSHEETPRR